MSWKIWKRNLRPSRKNNNRQKRDVCLSRRLLLESLEPRQLLTTFAVTSLADAGAGSLRDAIGQANAHAGADTITFAAGLTGTITLGGSQLAITDAVEIRGPGADRLTINANDRSRIFNVDDGNGGVAREVTIEGLKLTGGKLTGDSFGGAILNAENLTVTNSTISGNSASRGGGIGNQGSLTVTNSTISGNSASFTGGGIWIDTGRSMTVANSTISGNSAKYGGGMYNSSRGSLTVTNSTIYGNNVFGSSSGGGIFNDLGASLTVTNSTVSGNAGRIDNGGSMTITNSTISGNTGGIGITNFSNGTLTLNNSIVADSTQWGDIYNEGTLTGSHNLIQDGSGGLPDTISGDPRLGPLQDNGGPTRTQALLAGSPAIDAGDNSLAAGLDYDQRGPGFPRIVNGTVDLGAFEAALQLTVTPTLTVTADSVTYSGSVYADANVHTTVDPASAADHGPVSYTYYAAADVGTPLAGAPTNAGEYAVEAHYAASDPGYADADSNLAYFGIAKADAAVSVTGYTGTYNAAAHGATGSVAGVDADGGALGSSLDLGGSFTNVPGGTAHWVFTGGTNYNEQAGDVAIVFAKAVTTMTLDATANPITVGTVRFTANLSCSTAIVNVGAVAYLAVLDATGHTVANSTVNVGSGSASWDVALPAGNYTVTATYAGIGNFQGSSDFGLAGIAYVEGNVGGFGQGGAGWWANKNGQKVITSGDLAAVNGLYLVTSATNGADLTITSVSQLGNWLTANASNMAYKLSSVMVLAELNVLHSANLGTALVDASSLRASYYTQFHVAGGLDNGFISVANLIHAANEELKAHPLTTGGDPTRAYQDALRSLLEQVAGGNALSLAAIDLSWVG
ncbi:MAG: right-handed parallel beta-helix repeat-containing protein [Planctomycetota bacterium]|nr:right-handed parallel beta-helix repeat-containing protein [Planctomycetota bacterium]